MLWFFAEDNYHYKKEFLEELKKQYKLNKIISFPQINDIKSNSDNENIGFIAPYYPSFLGFKENNFLNVIRLKNKYEPFTTSQIKFNIPKEEILEQNLGIKVINSTLTFKNYIGAEKLIQEAKIIELKMLNGLNPKGLFLVGLPGTGKSFFTKCFAGETKRLLLELNFSKILEHEKPLDKLSMIINYLQNNPAKYLVWIDEIEKMFSNENSQQILGTFLTELNEFNSSKSNALFIATANNINELSFRNPELFRSGGRFDKIIALLPPTEDNAIKIMNYYFQSLKEKLMWDNFISAFILTFITDINYFKDTNLEELAFNFKDILKKENALKDIINDFENKLNIFYRIIFNKEVNLIEHKLKKFFSENDIKDISISDNNEEKFIILKNIFKKIFITYYEGNFKLKDIYNNYINNNYFQKEDMLQNIQYLIIKNYREDSAIKNRFPYTQAEISTFVSTLYSNFYFSHLDIQDAINKTIVDIIPLQVQMNEQIMKMFKSLENFLIV